MSVEKRGFGELEMAIMNIIWDRKSMTVQDVLDKLGSDHAYTTVMTVMGRMVQKGLLEREKNGRNYLYTPSREKPQEANNILEKLRKSVFKGNSLSMVNYLIGNADSMSEQDLENIQQMIAKKKKELQVKGN
jgi:predicted transcriptional regulator